MNSKADYNDFIRANLPSGMTFSSDRARYVVNGKSFVTYTEAEWYSTYVGKFDGVTPPPVESIRPVIDSFQVTDGVLSASLTEEDSPPVSAYLLRNSVTSYTEAQDVIDAVNSEGGFDQWAFEWGEGLTTVDLTLSTGNDGLNYFHLVVVDSVGNLSNVATTSDIVDTAPAPSEPAYITRGSTEDAYLTGPNLPAGTKAITVEFKALQIPVQPSSGSELIEWQSTTFKVQLDNRAGQGDLFVYVEDVTGNLFFNLNLDAIVTPGEEIDLLVSATQDDGTGTARYLVYVNGTEAASGTATAATAPNNVFASNRSLEILRATYQIERLERLRIWHDTTHAGGYATGGDTTGLTLRYDLLPDDFITPPAGLVTGGVDTFTVVEAT